MCPKCREVFDVKEKDIRKNDVVLCKNCKEGMYLKDGVRKLDTEFTAVCNSSYKALYNKQDYEKAEKLYNEGLKLKPNDFGCVIGLIWCSIYGSQISEPQYFKVIELLEKYDIVLDTENTFVFLSFIKEMLGSFEYYRSLVYKTISKDGIFFNKEFFEYYKIGLLQIKNVFKYFDDSFALLDQKETEVFISENPDFKNQYTEIKNIFNTELHQGYRVIDTGFVFLNDDEEEIRKEKIEDIELPAMVDLSFIPINKKAIKLRNYLIAIYGVLLVAIITFIVLFIVTQKVLFVILEFVPVGIAVIVYFVFKKLLEKII